MQNEELYSKPKPQNLSFVSLLLAYGLVLLVLLITLPKVYISTDIYYTSRSISTLRDQLGVLLEENRELKNKLEKIRYKNQIINNMN